MAGITKHELAYHVETEIAARLRALKVPRAKQIAIDLTPKVIEAVPTEAFDPIEPWERGIVYFHGDVEEDFVRKHQDLLTAAHINNKTGTPLTIYLSTNGGDLYAGLALFSTIQEIRRAGRQVNIHVQGSAFSFGSILCQACDVRTIEPYSYFMIHETSWGTDEAAKTSSVRDDLAYHERLEQTVFALYSARTGKPVDYYRQKMQRRDWYLTAREAVAERLVDRIKPVAKYPSKRTRPQKGDQ